MLSDRELNSRSAKSHGSSSNASHDDCTPDKHPKTKTPKRYVKRLENNEKIRFFSVKTLFNFNAGVVHRAMRRTLTHPLTQS